MTPAISVVVPTYRRAHLLPRLVAAFDAQRDAPDYELIIVDNASPDDTPAVLARLQASTAVPLVVRHVARNRGPATARNVGWRAAQGAAVAFMDDDCVPTPTWLGELSMALAESDVVIGRTVPDPAQAAGLGPFSRTMSVDHDDGLYPTCNVGYRRRWLEQLDGFDESFEAGGEDTDLAWRAIAGGAVTNFAGDAVVHHDVRASRFLTQLRDATHWHSLPLAVAKHPAIRSRLYAGVFWRRTHPPALLAAAGVAVLLGSPRHGSNRRAQRRRGAGATVGMAMLAPYLYARLVTDPLPYAGRRDRAALAPAALAIDLAEIAVLAAGSVRHRCLML